MYGVFSFLLVIGHSLQDNLIGHDCYNPTNMRFLSHDQCRHYSTATQSQNLAILQKINVQSLDGLSCAVEMTKEVGYCGAYSHTKSSGESLFNVPLSVSPDQCKTMIEDGAYVTEMQSFPLVMGKINLFGFYSHGSVTYSGTNIACVGENLRLSNGQINGNMIQKFFFQVRISSEELTISSGDVILPRHQTVIGRVRDGHGLYDMTPVILNPPAE
jgi:hypothetical protein